MGERSVTIGRDASGNAIVTGSNNLTFVFFGTEQVPAHLPDDLRSGRLRPAEAPGAVPLPALTLAIDLADETPWRITARRAHRRSGDARGAEPVAGGCGVRPAAGCLRPAGAHAL